MLHVTVSVGSPHVHALQMESQEGNASDADEDAEFQVRNFCPSLSRDGNCDRISSLF